MGGDCLCDEGVSGRIGVGVHWEQEQRSGVWNAFEVRGDVNKGNREPGKLPLDLPIHDLPEHRQRGP